MELEFSKGQGTGNDFVLVADPQGSIQIAVQDIKRLCDRRFGIGGDGYIRATTAEHVPDYAVLSKKWDIPEDMWFMDYWNADGSVAEMCGNGVRVFVHFLIHKNLVDLAVGQGVKIGTRAGIKNVIRTAVNAYSIDMGGWRFSAREDVLSKGFDSLVQTRGAQVSHPGVSVNMGNPHAVVMLEQRDQLAALDLSSSPTIIPVPPEGSNVEFIVLQDPVIRDNALQLMIRIYERGVGETFACGTGACAAAVAARLQLQQRDDLVPDHAGMPAKAAVWDIHQPGGVLRVNFLPSADGTEHIRLSGPAEIVFDGSR